MAPRKPTDNTAPRRTSKRLQLAKVEASKTDTKIVKKKSFRRPRQRKNCHLFKIPGEIRNQIYEYALLEPKKIKIKPTGPGEPPLLRVSKRIRDEASSIYYTLNTFHVYITDFDGAAVTPFSRQISRYDFHPPLNKGEGGASNVLFLMGGDAKWDNLVRWIKDVHNYQSTFRPDLDKPQTRNDYIVGAAFKLEEAMRWMGWGMVEKALSAFQHGLKGTCSAWGRDADDNDDEAYH
ncbi:hypothetical protein LTR10_001328 [Elasticomyces elasticus]|nr:hypothetical protein LTR10_001328 [Elasticomyces elasticus]KAK4965307.1 hypothetical protein LTR42_012061 [Elasticomyces elasticus]